MIFVYCMSIINSNILIFTRKIEHQNLEFTLFSGFGVRFMLILEIITNPLFYWLSSIFVYYKSIVKKYLRVLKRPYFTIFILICHGVGNVIS